MTPAEREVVLRGVIDYLETTLTKLSGTRLNFVLVIGEFDGGPGQCFVSHLTNTPRELAQLMLDSVYKKETKDGFKPVSA